jgi:hypothetical protein
LEIGAGTGSTTARILNALEYGFESNTFTDLSSGFFPKAHEKFDAWQYELDFCTLDIEQDPTSQGFKE